MKKGVRIFAFIITSLFLISFLAGVVSAAEDARAIGSDVNSFFNQIGEFAQGLFGTNNVPLQKIYLSFLLVLVVYSLVKDLFRVQGGLAWVISAVIGLLSMSLISDDLANMIVLQYGAMGAAILTVIPLAIMIIFTLSASQLIVARIAWLFYVIYYFFLNISIWFNGGGNWYSVAALVVGVIMFLTSGFLREFLTNEGLKSAREEAEKKMKARVALDNFKKEEATKVGFDY